MNTPSEDDLILYHYGEAEDPQAIARALASDPELARRYAELERSLDLLSVDVVPEPGPGYGQEVWARLEPKLALAEPRGRLLAFPARRVWVSAVLAAAAALLLAIGYWAGRSATPALPELASLDRARLVTRSAAAHFAGSERLLIELANTSPAGAAELAAERAWAESLLEDNRLLRSAAERAGQRRIAALLAELEPILLELAHAPDTWEPAELEGLQERLEAGDTLFKLKSTTSRLRTDERLHPKVL